uniref:Uncharacterized protein n=1 Tax=Rhizophora mucronata TaxID=61149 RepID=A0A2P2IQS1_RHIMU
MWFHCSLSTLMSYDVEVVPFMSSISLPTYELFKISECFVIIAA